MLKTKLPSQFLDLALDQSYQHGSASDRAIVDLGGARTVLYVPLIKDESVIGTVAIYRQEVRPFVDKQIALLENFAAQAVIAMENARLLNELRQRQEELRPSPSKTWAMAWRCSTKPSTWWRGTASSSPAARLIGTPRKRTISA